ncbi:MAG: TerD family protein [Psychrobacter sp.]|nr:TerD family protein [Psychrobacter sp.]
MSATSPNEYPTVAPPPSIISDSLTNLGLTTDTLYYGLKFKATSAPLSGLLNRLRKKQSDMDLDIACALYSEGCDLIDLVWFKALRDKSAAVRHQGDSLNGKDRGQQALFDGPLNPEQIEIRLNRLPRSVAHIALILTSYHGQSLREVEAGTVRLSDDEGHHAFSINLTSLPDKCNAMWVAHLRREVDEWHLTVQNLALETKDMPEISTFIATELARSLPTVVHFK